MAGAVMAAVALGLLFPVGAAIWHLAGIGVILGCVSPAGDLLESKIKRLANVKDSGTFSLATVGCWTGLTVCSHH